MVVLWITSIDAYSVLPSRIPVHFSWDGTPNRWSDKTPFQFFMLPALATILSALMVFLSRFPHLYNFPQKEEVKKWPLEKRQPVYDLLNRMMFLIALLISVMFLFIQMQIIEGAKLQKMTPINMWPMWILVVVIVIMPIYYLVKLSRLVKELQKAVNRI